MTRRRTGRLGELRAHWKAWSGRLAFVLVAAIPGPVVWADDTASGEGASAPFRVAFSSSMFAEVNENDAGAATRVWAQMLGRDHGIPVDSAAKTLRGPKEIADAMQNNLVDSITMTTEEYWLLRKEISVDHFVVGVKRGSVTEEYVLVVHRDSGIERIEDLRSRSLVIFQNPRASLAQVWLETLLAEAKLGRPADLCVRLNFFNKLSRVILPVFFRQTDACLVTRSGFETMSELNPQVGRQLKVLASSPAVVPTVFCCRANQPSPYRDPILAQLGVVNSSPAGQQFLTLFQVDSLQQSPLSCLDSACELLDRHQQFCHAADVAGTAEPAAPSKPADDQVAMH
jgi:ABC-type phosphate/phosphonate transport system substrate-binding protein